MKHLSKLLILALGLHLPLLSKAEIVVDNSDFGTVDITWYSPQSVRVTKLPAGITAEPLSLSVTAKPANVKLKKSSSPSYITLNSGKLKVTVDKTTGQVAFYDSKGNLLIKECSNGSFSEINDCGKPAYAVAQSYALAHDEDIYGLGILQNGKMSQRGENRVLAPGNTEDGITFFQSNKGYGLFWDNYSTTTISDVDDVITFSSEVADAINYCVMYGGNADGVISEVRMLTGDVPMSPMWTYGFSQSKERYKSQDEIVGVLKKYRKLGVPIDCMIQDWQYWGSNYLWNAMEFLNENYPDPKRMMNDIHGQNAKCMISIWQSFGPMTKQYRELDERGLLMDIQTWPQSGSSLWPPRMDYPSGVRVYSPYSEEARDIYWNHLRRLYDIGLDGWWMDSTEPDHFDVKDSDFDYCTPLGSYRKVRLAYPLMCVGGVYDHQRATSDTTRVFILTRSGSFGQQRYGAQVWSGDIVSTWDMLRKQVPAGLNFSLTGNPNFNVDLGGFFAGSYNWSWQNKPAQDNPAYRELYARWMQLGAFLPMMRSHGADVPREIYLYGAEGEPIYDALLGAIKLRYRLLPYIYSTAHQVSDNRGTFMRALMMDFPDDKKATDNASEYMFGQSILATPVLYAQYTPEVIRHDSDANAGWDKNTGRVSLEDMDKVNFLDNRQHSVYLPKGTTWYYFNDNKAYDGGQHVDLDVNITDIPFFVKAGSILPIGPDVQYTSEKPWDCLEIRIYKGADGQFTLYEDAGDGYNYEKGEFTEVPMSWSDKSRTLTIDNLRGAYPGMLSNRTFDVKLIDSDGSISTKSVAYDGKQIKVKF